MLILGIECGGVYGQLRGGRGSQSRELVRIPKGDLPVVIDRHEYMLLNSDHCGRVAGGAGYKRDRRLKGWNRQRRHGGLSAVADHGQLEGILSPDGGDGEAVLAKFAAAGIDIDALAARLQDEGAKSFVKSWNELLDVIASKSAALATGVAH